MGKSKQGCNHEGNSDFGHFFMLLSDAYSTPRGRQGVRLGFRGTGYTQRMPADREWVEQKLKEIEHKREILRALLDCLRKWEDDVDWDSLPASKQAALMALAHESTDTLQHMIGRLRDDIQERMTEVNRSTGLTTNGAGQP